MHPKNASLVLLLAAFLTGQAQDVRNTGFFGNANADTRVCPPGSNFMSEEDVSGLVSEMLGRIGAMNRYVIIACPQVENCQATVFNGRPYILYNPVFLQSGFATPKDDLEATRWYYLCALRGEGTCMSSMASRYIYGLGGVEVDYAEGMRWARMAVEKKTSGGYLYMGIIYEMGMGVPKDATEAAQWYRKAADQGNTIAVERLRKLGENH